MSELVKINLKQGVLDVPQDHILTLATVPSPVASSSEKLLTWVKFNDLGLKLLQDNHVVGTETKNVVQELLASTYRHPACQLSANAPQMQFESETGPPLPLSLRLDLPVPVRRQQRVKNPSGWLTKLRSIANQLGRKSYAGPTCPSDLRVIEDKHFGVRHTSFPPFLKESASVTSIWKTLQRTSHSGRAMVTLSQPGLRRLVRIVFQEVIFVMNLKFDLESPKTQENTYMKLGCTKTLSPSKSSPSRRHHDEHDHIQRAVDKAMSGAGKRRPIRRSTTGDCTHPLPEDYGPRAMDFIMDSPVSYPPNAIVRRLARCTQAGSKFGPCGMSGALASVELRFAAKASAAAVRF
ncbi:hypothetical protein F4604DRAFT_1673940 [Suillus subluteus]|nr:hypothetical protein F4604DRAFT_1673940 [Suillus subluteus]